MMWSVSVHVKLCLSAKCGQFGIPFSALGRRLTSRKKFNVVKLKTDFVFTHFNLKMQKKQTLTSC